MYTHILYKDETAYRQFKKKVGLEFVKCQKKMKIVVSLCDALYFEITVEDIDERNAYSQIERGKRAGGRSRSAKIATRERGTIRGGQETSGRIIKSITKCPAGSLEHKSCSGQS